MTHRINYNLILRNLIQGESLNSINKKHGFCPNNIRKHLKKLYPEEFELYVHGKVIDEYNGFLIRKAPKNHANRVECNITKKAKEILSKRYDCMEEVCVWNGEPLIRNCVDLYSIKNKLAIEIIWKSKENIKQLIKRLNTYKLLFGNILCVLVNDSRNNIHTLQYKRLKSSGFNVEILTIPSP